jgi:hypothetical protein
MFTCETCGKVCKSRDTLRNHRIAMHTKDYPYRCHICGNGFVLPCQLKQHIIEHDGVSDLCVFSDEYIDYLIVQSSAHIFHIYMIFRQSELSTDFLILLHIHIRSLFWPGTCTLIKIGRVKLALCIKCINTLTDECIFYFCSWFFGGKCLNM